MTSIVAWVAVDARAPSSLYVASDSRITWGGPTQRWDQGRKVFACLTEAHLFAYVGDVLFPALALPAIADRIDRGLLVDDGRGSGSNVREAVRLLHSDYPAKCREDFGIVHGYRSGEGMECRFHLAITKYNAVADSWQAVDLPMPEKSSILHVDGSGSQAVRDSALLWQQSPSRDTSRAMFGAFHEAVSTGADPLSGGAPQVGGLYRIGSGRIFGLVLDDKRYLSGARLVGREDVTGIEWRNNLFERVDGKKRKRLPGAQKHHPRTGA